jgi:cbb3-type cytochrome oxidase subunit 3
MRALIPAFAILFIAGVIGFIVIVVLLFRTGKK